MQNTIGIYTSRTRLICAAVYATLISTILIIVGVGESVSVYQYGFLIPEILFSTVMIALEIEIKSRRPKLIYNAVLLIILSIMMTATFDLMNGMYGNPSEMGFWYSFLRFAISTIFCLLIYMIFVVIFGRVRMAAIVGTVCYLVFAIISYAVWTLRGSRLVFTDFTALRTAIDVLGGYPSLPLTSAFYLGILSTVCMIPVLLQLKTGFYPLSGKTRVCCYLAFVYLFFGLYSTNFERYEYSWSEVENSYLYSFFANMKFLNIKAPSGYSPEEAEEIIMDADAEATLIDSQYDAQAAIKSAFPQYSETPVVRPNIIVVMNESYSDLSVFGDIPSDEVFPYTSQLANSLQGDVFTEVFGGGTADSEYSFLTGNSTLILPTNARPYQLYVDENTPNMVSELREIGYQAVAIHPGIPTAWSRSRVYDDFDFNAFYDNAFFADSEYKRIPQLYSDEATNEKIEELYEEKNGAPLFAFDVTIQNHGGYELGYENLDKIETGEGVPDEVTEYLSLVRASDIAFGELVDFFKNQDEPTIVCMFGDHQPNLLSHYVEDLVGKEENEFDIKESQRLQATPYIIWANYPLPSTQVGSVSINFLSTIVLQCAGIESTPYQHYLASLHDKYLIVDRKGIIDRDGEYYTYDELDGERKEDIDEYRKVLYYTIVDSENLDYDLYHVPDG